MSFSHPIHQRLLPGQHVSTTGEILTYAASAYPEKTGFICGTRHWTFHDMDRAANRFANFILSDLAERDGPIGIIGKNSAEYIVTHFGTARTGRHTANFHTRCTEDDLVDALDRTRPALLVVDADCKKLVDAALKRVEVPPIVMDVSGGAPEDDQAFWQLFADQPDTHPTVEIEPDGPGSVIFTGGTTGRPKAVLSSHRARALSAMAAVEDFHIDPTETGGYSVPFTHAAGLFSWFQPAVLAGCTGVIIPKWDPGKFMQLAEQHEINIIFAVPAQLTTLLQHPDFRPQRLHSLRRIVFGGAPISRALIERAESVMPWLSCERAYGSSETGHLAAQSKAGRSAIYDGLNQPGGRLEIEIFKGPGDPAEIGEIGEVATRGEHLMTGYLGDPHAEAEFFRSETTDGDWGWMGDLARKHDGCFSLVGRSKHMILSGGLNIYPAELENILDTHPEIIDCAVFGMEDETWGEVPAAAIIPAHADIDTQSIIEYVAGRVARYKRLRQIFVTDEIPRTTAGKVQIHVIKNRFAGSH